MIDRADLGALGLERRIGLGGEPRPYAVRLEVGRFLACGPTERCEMLATSPRLTASRANSFWLQWVIGRPQAAGGSQARATIAQTCSAVKVAGAPERGASARRPAMLPSSLPASQRRRQKRTVLASTPYHACRRAHALAGRGQQDDPGP
jgi:hypothetical protein